MPERRSCCFRCDYLTAKFILLLWNFSFMILVLVNECPVVEICAHDLFFRYTYS